MNLPMMNANASFRQPRSRTWAEVAVHFVLYCEFPGAHSVRRHYGVVTDRYKLFHFYEPEMNYWTLMDREKDPLELKNVYDDPAYADTRKTLHAELARLRTELKVPAQDAAGTGSARAGGAARKGKAKAK